MTKSPMTLMFAGLTPIMAVGNTIDSRRKGKKTQRSEADRFAKELAQFREQLAGTVAEERSRREAALPDPAEIMRRVTLPNVKWSLLYGILLCNGRAIGEFGAVAVVSGHIIGLTNTMPLQVEVLYNDYAFAAAFAVASLLTLMALATLALKTWLEWRAGTLPARTRLH